MGDVLCGSNPDNQPPAPRGAAPELRNAIGHAPGKQRSKPTHPFRPDRARQKTPS